jgi:thioredoxin
MTINEFVKDLGPELTVVDFWAPWCTACKALMPGLEKATAEKEIKLVKVNVDESADFAKSFGVRSIPCVILFKNDEEVHRFLGNKSYPEVSQILDDHK